MASAIPALPPSRSFSVRFIFWSDLLPFGRIWSDLLPSDHILCQLPALRQPVQPSRNSHTRLTILQTGCSTAPGSPSAAVPLFLCDSYFGPLSLERRPPARRVDCNHRNTRIPAIDRNVYHSYCPRSYTRGLDIGCPRLGKGTIKIGCGHFRLLRSQEYVAPDGALDFNSPFSYKYAAPNGAKPLLPFGSHRLVLTHL
jgi:hypothetical protein